MISRTIMEFFKLKLYLISYKVFLTRTVQICAIDSIKISFVMDLSVKN
jgi:hypothetical protein